MLYIISTIIAAVSIGFLLGISILIDYKNIKKINILTITLTSILIALSVVLTNIIGYNITFKSGIKLSLGNFIIFVLGMLLGPFIGVLGGIATDLLGVLVNISGTFVLGFTLNISLYGFFGSLVFIFKKNKLWYVKAIFFYILTFIIISFALNIFWLYSIGLNTIILRASFIIKLIKLPIEMLIYVPLMLITFTTLYKLLSTRHNIEFWAISKK